MQLGRPLIREPFFARRLRAGEAAADGRKNVDVESKCVRCNLCTLASIDPVKFPAGCPFLRKGEGAAFGDIEDLASATAKL